MFTSPDEVAAYIRDNDVEFVDVRFCDLPGVMQHFTIPASTFGEDTFSEGLGFDGSSIRGFQAINESDMLLLPDANSAYLDPFRRHKTLNVNFFIHDPITREAYSRDPQKFAKNSDGFHDSRPSAARPYRGGAGCGAAPSTAPEARRSRATTSRSARCPASPKQTRPRTETDDRPAPATTLATTPASA